MFYWTECCCHGNTASNKLALNNGFDLFSENPFIRFFSNICLQKALKNTGLLTVVSWHFDREIFCNSLFCILTFSEDVLRQISIFVCRRVMRVLNYYSLEFHEILTSASLNISAFPLSHAAFSSPELWSFWPVPRMESSGGGQDNAHAQ